MLIAHEEGNFVLPPRFDGVEKWLKFFERNYVSLDLVPVKHSVWLNQFGRVFNNNLGAASLSLQLMSRDDQELMVGGEASFEMLDSPRPMTETHLRID